MSFLWFMAGTTGLEPATSAVTGQRSNQLSYVPKKLFNNLVICHIESSVQISQFSFVSTVSLLCLNFSLFWAPNWTPKPLRSDEFSVAEFGVHSPLLQAKTPTCDLADVLTEDGRSDFTGPRECSSTWHRLSAIG